MQPKHIKMTLSIVLAWLPSLFWMVFAATGIVLGVGGLFSSEPLGGLIFVALGVGGILGFIGLTIVCWTQRELTPMIITLLAFGVISLLVVSGYLMLGRNQIFRDPETLLKATYFMVCPLLFGFCEIFSYFRKPSSVH